MSKLTKGYGSEGMQEILGDIKTYYETELAKKANTSDLGTAASKNATNQITEGSTALPEAGAVKTALDGKISTSNTPGHVMNDGTIDTNTYEKSGVAETLVKDTVGWMGKNRLANKAISKVDGTLVFTVDDEGKIIVGAGTASQTIAYYILTKDNGDWSAFSGKTLILNGTANNAGGARFQFWSTTTGTKSDDDGTGIEIEFPVIEPSNWNFAIYIPNGTVLSETKVFEPMLRDASITDPTYEPYHATVDTVKADKVTNATSGHLAGLDSNGNLTDSGVSPTEEVTVEGNPVTFDSPFEQDAKSVVVSVEPIQDLHGYDHPWPAGGGKNKLPLVLADIKSANTSGTWNGNVYTLNDITFDVKADSADNISEIIVNGSVTSGQSRSDFYLFLNNAIDIYNGMILNGTPSDGSDATYYTTIIGNDSPYISYSDEGNGVTIGNYGSGDTGKVYITIRSGFTAINLSFKPMISTNGGTFEQYSNICPISGTNEVEIPVTGKNILNPNSIVQGTKTNPAFGTRAGTRGDFSMSVKSGDVITVLTQTSGYRYSIEVIDKDYNSYQDSGWKTSTYTFTANHDGFIYIGWSNTDGVTPISVSDIVNAHYMVYRGSESTEYEPYKGHTTTIALPQTVYDGDVDVENGDADSRFGIAIFDGSEDESWLSNTPAWSASCFAIYNMLVGAKSVSGYDTVANILSNKGSAKTPAQLADRSNSNHGVAQGDGTRLFINLSNDIDTVEKLRAYLAEHPLQVCYELATPTTISFDPTDVELLEGTNVVSTNGEKVAVTYKAGILATLGDIDNLNDKVKTKFDKKDVAKVEGANASKPYAVGDYMLRSDGFYVVTQAIAQNAPITSNNTDKTTVGNELSSKVNTDDSRLSDARTPVAHTHNISDITGIPAWTKLGEVTGTSPDYANSSTFNLSALQNKDVLMIFSVDEGTLTAKQGIITLEYSAFEFGKILEDSVQEEDEITRLWKGFYGGAPRESVATFEEFLRGLGYIYIATHSTTAEIGAKIYGAYDWTLEIYTK